MLSLKKIHPTIFLATIIAAHLFFLIQIAFWPYPEFRIYPYLTTHGLIPYKQIIDQHFPGVFFFPVNLYTLGLANPLGLRLLQLSIVAINQILIYLTMKKLTRSSYSGLIANVLFLLAQPLYEGYILWVDSIISPLILLAYYVLIKKERKETLPGRNYFIAGLLISLSVLIKQAVFPVFIFLLAYLGFLKVDWKRLTNFVAGFAIPILYLVVYIQQLGVWKEFWYWNFTFNQTVYPAYFFRQPTIKETLLMLPLMLAFLVASSYFFYRKKRRETITLLLTFAVPILLLLYGTWAFIHLQPFIPFAVIVTALFILDQPRKQAYIEGSVYSLLLFLVMLTHVRHVGNSSTINDSEYKPLIQEMHTLTQEKKSIFLYDIDYELYQLSDTIPANKLYVPNLPWYTDLLDHALLTSVIQSKPDIIITPVQNSKSQMTNYFKSAYKKLMVIKDTEILEKK